MSTKAAPKVDKNKKLASDRLRVYPLDGNKLRILAKKRGGKTMPADLIHEWLSTVTS